MSQRISGVWYLPSANKLKDLNLLAMKDTGSLILEKGELIFIGNKFKKLSIKHIQSISYGKQGRDFINNWVKIIYSTEEGEKKVAYFADGKLIGWSGIFGGTKSIMNKIQKANSID
jgi:hypothetical protein